MLDLLDKGILNDLGNNCRFSYKTLADKYRVSSTAIKKRVEKLISSGVIAKFTIEYHLSMIDGEFFLALVHTDATI